MSEQAVAVLIGFMAAEIGNLLIVVSGLISPFRSRSKVSIVAFLAALAFAVLHVVAPNQVTQELFNIKRGYGAPDATRNVVWAVLVAALVWMRVFRDYANGR